MRNPVAILKRTSNAQPSTSNAEFKSAGDSSPNLELSAEQAIEKIGIMKFTKNIGMVLLALYLIVDGLLGFGLNIGPAIFLLYIIALAHGGQAARQAKE